MWFGHGFIDKHTLHGSATSAIAFFNEGSIQLSQVMERLVIEINPQPAHEWDW